MREAEYIIVENRDNLFRDVRTYLEAFKESSGINFSIRREEYGLTATIRYQGRIPRTLHCGLVREFRAKRTR